VRPPPNDRAARADARAVLAIGRGQDLDLAQRCSPSADADLSLSVSVTTRRPRPGETGGRDYHFIDRGRRFRLMVNRGELLEHAKVFGNSYGTPRAAVEAALAGPRRAVRHRLAGDAAAARGRAQRRRRSSCCRHRWTTLEKRLPRARQDARRSRAAWPRPPTR
jgi:guanylate kinase